MLFDNINELEKTIEKFQEEDRIIAYYPLEEQGVITYIAQKGTEKSFSEIIYSEHNCEVLERKIERGILEEEKYILNFYEMQKKAGGFAMLSLIVLNLCCIGQFSLALFLMSTGFLVFHLKVLKDIKKQCMIYSYYHRFIAELKEGTIKLTDEEIKLLNEEENKMYEKSNEVSIGNLRVVCNPKVLKKHFGEK